jgi:hypothetical protein
MAGRSILCVLVPGYLNSYVQTINAFTFSITSLNNMRGEAMNQSFLKLYDEGYNSTRDIAYFFFPLTPPQSIFLRKD